MNGLKFHVSQVIPCGYERNVPATELKALINFAAGKVELDLNLLQRYADANKGLHAIASQLKREIYDQEVVYEYWLKQHLVDVIRKALKIPHPSSLPFALHCAVLPAYVLKIEEKRARIEWMKAQQWVKVGGWLEPEVKEWYTMHKGFLTHSWPYEYETPEVFTKGVVQLIKCCTLG